MSRIAETPLTRREAIAALGALALSACFSDRSTNPPEEGGVEVEMVDLSFEPATVNIDVGDRVTWRNTSQFVHTATCDPSKANDSASVNLPAGAAAFDSGAVSPGGTFSHVFEVAGEYRYFCIPHESQGMVATVVVS